MIIVIPFSLPIMLLLRHGFCISFPSQRGHIERNLEYSPENEKEMIDKTICRRAIIEKIDPHEAEKVQESDKKWPMRCTI